VLSDADQARNQLWTPGGVVDEEFSEGDPNFTLVSTIRNAVVLNYVQRISPGDSCGPLSCGPDVAIE